MAEKIKQLYFDFDEYIRQGEPEAAKSAEQWNTAIGLQAVDGIKPSNYLLETAKRNIEGEITIDEVQELLRSYYASAANRSKIEDDDEEADKAAANIKRILSTKTLAFNTNGYIATHRRIFEGVFKHAGELRKYDITKKEWVLKGDTVNYLNWEDLRRAIDYDIQQEKEFNYKGLSDIEKVKHLCRFTAGLWQIHAFCEGNTRTTAVFLIQYLRSIGYKVNNDLFAHHSWYFRNALVRANYKNSKLGINYDYQYLERFFYNLLLGEHHELKNRYLVIDAPDNWNTAKPNAANTQENKEKTEDVGSMSVVQLTERQKNIYKLINDNPQVSTAEMSVVLSVVKRTIERDLSMLRKMGIITREGNTSAGKWVILKRDLTP